MRHLRLSSQNINNPSLLKVASVFNSSRFINIKSTNAAASSSSSSAPDTATTRRRSAPRRCTRRRARIIPVVAPKRASRVFRCRVCISDAAGPTRNKREMLRHLETHVGAPQSCLRCKRTFNGAVSYDWHVHHYCVSASRRRASTATVKRFKCNQCDREFISKVNLNCHLLGHKRNNCSYCDKVITRQIDLIKHLLEVHSIKLERTLYSCEYCEKRYIKKFSLFLHLRQHIKSGQVVCLECGKFVDAGDDFERHQREHNAQKHFQCPKCDDRFSRRQQFLYHLKRHNQFHCVTCNEGYASRLKAMTHKRMGHQVDGLHPRYLCPHCPRAYHQRNKLHAHLRKHSNENHTSIPCKYCKKSFKSPYSYYKHCITISHDKFSPEISNFPCDQCGKRFIKRHLLKQHMYRVHNHIKSPILCEHCDYRTYNKCNMTRHVALHFRNVVPQFTCEHCGKNFDNIACLKSHIAYNHLMDKLFVCNVCGKSFKRNSELARHQDSHSDERPHVCRMCGKSYKRVTHMKRHEKSAHKFVEETKGRKKVNAVVLNSEEQHNEPLLLFKQQAEQDDDDSGLMNFNDLNELSIVDQLVNSFAPIDNDVVFL